MKIAFVIIRVLMGLLFMFASIVVLFNLFPQPELTGKALIFMEGVNVSRYLLPLIKITELFCGIAFVSGFYVPLATVLIAPITINILLYHAFVAPEQGLPVAVFLVLGNIFLAYANWDKFKPVLEAK